VENPSRLRVNIMRLTLFEFNSRFQYKSDGSLDTWRILKSKGDVNAPMEGDCDDYAATVLYITEGWSIWRWWMAILTFRAVFWYCRDPSNQSHICLWHRYHGWIDNHYPEWSTECRHRLRFPALLPIAALKMFLGRLFG